MGNVEIEGCVKPYDLAQDDDETETQCPPKSPFPELQVDIMGLCLTLSEV